jgi:hypothetical protein
MTDLTYLLTYRPTDLPYIPINQVKFLDTRPMTKVYASRSSTFQIYRSDQGSRAQDLDIPFPNKSDSMTWNSDQSFSQPNLANQVLANRISLEDELRIYM